MSNTCTLCLMDRCQMPTGWNPSMFICLRKPSMMWPLIICHTSSHQFPTGILYASDLKPVIMPPNYQAMSCPMHLHIRYTSGFSIHLYLPDEFLLFFQDPAQGFPAPWRFISTLHPWPTRARAVPLFYPHQTVSHSFVYMFFSSIRL